MGRILAATVLTLDEDVNQSAHKYSTVSNRILSRTIRSGVTSNAISVLNRAPVETDAQRAALFQCHVVAVTENTLSQLQIIDELTAHDADVFVDITVFCPEKGCTPQFKSSSIVMGATVMRSPLRSNTHSSVISLSVLCNAGISTMMS